MTWFDLVAALLFLGGVFLGFRLGAVRQIGGLLGAALGIGLVLLLLTFFGDSLQQLDTTNRALTVLLALVLATVVGQNLGAMVGAKVASGDEPGVAGTSNRILGALLGAVQAAVVIWLVTTLTTLVPEPTIAAAAQRSATAQWLAETVPPPTQLAQNLTESIQNTQYGYLFDGLAPAPAPMSDLPNESQVRSIAESAAASTMKVISSGCPSRGVGSGVVIAQQYVVTNAHVVSGAGFIQIDHDGIRLEAIPVRVDTNLDAALLYVPGLTAPALNWAESDPGRGETGAVLGYPGGGSLTIVGAAVNREIMATGTSLNGTRPVQRQVLELTAKVEPGNSGGPMVLRNGTIGGLVFAESPTDPSIGYALAPTEVAAALDPAIGRTQRVPTGSCLA